MKEKLLDISGVALYVAVSAGGMFLISELLKMPELAPYYGVLNIALYALKSLKK